MEMSLCLWLMDQWASGCQTAHVVTNQMATEVFMRRERRIASAPYLGENWPDWTMIRDWVWTKQATGLPYDALLRRLFLHDYTEEPRWLENSYKGAHWRWIKQQWKNCQAWFAGPAVARSPSQWVSLWRFVMAMDQWTWESTRTGLAHTAGNLPAQTSTGRERRSHAWPVKVRLYALYWLRDYRVIPAAGSGYPPPLRFPTTVKWQVHWGLLSSPLHHPCHLDRAHASCKCPTTHLLLGYSVEWYGAYSAGSGVCRYNRVVVSWRPINKASCGLSLGPIGVVNLLLFPMVCFGLLIKMTRYLKEL